jgi:hypothetical protein
MNETLTVTSPAGTAQKRTSVSAVPSFRLQAGHVSDDDLECLYLGMILQEQDLAAMEEHLLVCPECIERAQASQVYIDGLRAAFVGGNLDLL